MNNIFKCSNGILLKISLNEEEEFVSLFAVRATDTPKTWIFITDVDLQEAISRERATL